MANGAAHQYATPILPLIGPPREGLFFWGRTPSADRVARAPTLSQLPPLQHAWLAFTPGPQAAAVVSRPSIRKVLVAAPAHGCATIWQGKCWCPRGQEPDAAKLRRGFTAALAGLDADGVVGLGSFPRGRGSLHRGWLVTRQQLREPGPQTEWHPADLGCRANWRAPSLCDFTRTPTGAGRHGLDGSRPRRSRRGEQHRSYSATTSPEPPNSFGKSLNFGRPSRTGMTFSP